MKKFFKTVLSVCLAMTVLSACEEKPVDPQPPIEEPEELYLTVPESVELPSGGKTTRIELKSNTSWSFEGGESWLQIDPLSGQNDKRVALTTNDNTSINERSCILTVVTDDGTISRSINVIQFGAEQILEVNVLGDFAPEENSEINIEVIANGSWTIEGDVPWIRLSQTKGSGNAMVKATALTTNYSSNDRSALFTVISGDKSADIEIFQKAAWLSNCKMNINDDFVILYDDIAFTCEHVGDVMRYHYYVFEKDEVSVNDLGALANAVIQNSIEEGYWADPKKTAEADKILHFNSSLNPNTDYILYVIALNKEGQQGEISSLEFRTLTNDINKTPYAYVSYDDENNGAKWRFWVQKANSMTSYYYIWTTTDIDRVNLFWSQLAYISQNEIKNNSDKYVKNSNDWYYDIPFSPALAFIVWGIDVDGNFGSDYDMLYTLPDDSMSLNQLDKSNKIMK